MPIATLVADVGNDPQNVMPERINDDDFGDLVRNTYAVLKSGNMSDGKIRSVMQSAEPFRSMWNMVEDLIAEFEKEV